MRWESYDLGGNHDLEGKHDGQKEGGKQSGKYIFKTENTTLPSHSQIQVVGCEVDSRLKRKFSVYSFRTRLKRTRDMAINATADSSSRGPPS